MLSDLYGIISGSDELKVLWLTNIPSPYRVDFFNELGKTCKLLVLFEKAYAKDREEGWINHSFLYFKGIFLKGKSVAADKAFCPEVIKIIKKYHFDYIVIANPATPTGILAIVYMKLHKLPYLIEGDGGLPKDGKGIKERFKRHLLKGAKAYFSTSRTHDEYYIGYGVNKELIYRYPFTSVRRSEICYTVPDHDHKELIRRTLGISEKKVMVSVGRVIPVKGFDLILHAARSLSSEIGIYIIGGQPNREYLEFIQEANLTNIHFIDFQSKEALKQYYQMADLFVLPTRGDSWGLVINEAMSNGLPVITTDRCVAGLELVEDNKNGYIVPTENVTMLVERIKRVLEEDDLRVSMAEYSLRIIRDYTIEAMATRHMEVFKELRK